jgi:hypothetical protein
MKAFCFYRGIPRTGIIADRTRGLINPGSASLPNGII